MPDPVSLPLSELARYMNWADATVWKAVLSTAASAGDETLGNTLHHIHLVQHIFLQSWTGSPFKVSERSEFPTLEALRDWGRQAHDGVQRYLSSAQAAELGEPYRVPWAAHFEQRSGTPAGVHTLGESVLQVLLHTQHHRGQVCSRLRELGGEPPTVDLIVWYWAGRPDAAWEISPATSS